MRLRSVDGGLEVSSEHLRFPMMLSMPSPISSSSIDSASNHSIELDSVARLQEEEEEEDSEESDLRGFEFRDLSASASELGFSEPTSWVVWCKDPASERVVANGGRSSEVSKNGCLGALSLQCLPRFFVENMLGYIMARRAVASVHVWLGLFRGVRGFFVEIASGTELLVESESVDDD